MKEVELVRGLKYKVPLQKNNSRAQNVFGRSGFEETLHSRLVSFLTRKPEKKLCLFGQVIFQLL